MIKNLDYYLRLPYTRELIPEPSGIWFIRIKELPNCISQGNSPEEALRNINDAMYGWLKGELEDGEPIPEPREEEEYSGKFNTRVSKSLHRKLVEAADREGVSLNQWINTAMAEAVGGSVARKSIQAAKAEVPAVESAWPGLSAAIQHVLDDVDMHREAAAVDEQLFAIWMGQNLEEIRSECQHDDYEQAMSKARALSILLQEHQNRSPVMRVIHRMATDQTRLLEQTCKMRQAVLEAEQVQAQISAMISSVNSPVLGRIRDLENDRYATRTSPREVRLSVREPEDAIQW